MYGIDELNKYIEKFKEQLQIAKEQKTFWANREQDNKDMIKTLELRKVTFRREHDHYYKFSLGVPDWDIYFCVYCGDRKSIKADNRKKWEAL